MTTPSRPPQHRPLVSVLIRTIGRPSLARAVASACRQGVDLEVVIVNAGGQPIASPLAEDLQAAVRWIEPGQRLDRSAAANALLDAAAGDYGLFLDDDDWLLEGHLTKLVEALDADPALAAAYGDVQCVSGAGTDQERQVHVYATDFDAAALQLQNFLPIHAVLFRRETVEAPPPCRFAAELELFEDWDFWLQLSRRGAFRRVPGVSAVYALDAAAGSGHADPHSPWRRSMLTRLAERQLGRWAPAQLVDVIERDVARSVRIQQLEQAAQLLMQTRDGLQQALDQRNARILELADTHRQLQDHSRLQQAEIDKLGRVRLDFLQQIQGLQHQVQLMQGSLSWRVTRPLRGAKALAQRAVHHRIVRTVRNLTGAVANDIRKHGVTGFARRVPYYLRNHRAYLHRLRGGGPATAADAFHARPPEVRDLPLHPDLLDAAPPIDAKVSIVIPTLNAGAEFALLLRKLRGQQGVREVEIVIVDSGSKDDTVALAREAGAVVVEILPSEFSHSYARNLGADNASGDYLLFMVQDAYPVGNRWLQGLLAFLLAHADDKLAAVSCAEYSRSDSEMAYDAMIDTHYRFLGCLEADRIGDWQGDDHMALRSRGQLSDVTCLIPRERFMQYRYRGNYAEDLDLGIRLIKDGMKVAMLASVKTVHSHFRPAWYYLRRTFVDVIFLVGLFDDFLYPRCESLSGLVAGIGATGAHISRWLESVQPADGTQTVGELLQAWIRQARAELQPGAATGPLALGEPAMESFLAGLVATHASQGASGSAAQQEFRRFTDMFLGRLEHFANYAAQVYGPADARLQREMSDAIRKTYASTVGAALAFHGLDARKEDGPDRAAADALHDQLVVGV